VASSRASTVASGGGHESTKITKATKKDKRDLVFFVCFVVFVFFVPPPEATVYRLREDYLGTIGNTIADAWPGAWKIVCVATRMSASVSSPCDFPELRLRA